MTPGYLATTPHARSPTRRISMLARTNLGLGRLWNRTIAFALGSLLLALTGGPLGG